MKRVLSLILVLAIMVGMIPNGLAETATPSELSQEQSEPTAQPTAEPTPVPTAVPTEQPTSEPTAEVTQEPTVEATQEPKVEVTQEPTTVPTEQPTTEPTEQPTTEPTAQATAEPTEQPTAEPTAEPVKEAEEFIPGYAAVSTGTRLYASAEMQGVRGVIAQEGVVFAYALGESNAQAVAVWFAVEGKVSDAWVKAERIDMLDETETSRYLAQTGSDCARVPQHGDRFLLADVVLKTKEDETTATPAPVEAAETDEETETAKPAQTVEKVEAIETEEPVEPAEPVETAMAAPAMLAAPLAEEPITLTLPAGPYYVGEDYEIGVSIPGAQAYTVTWISEGNEYCSAYQDTAEYDLTEGQGSFVASSWWALAETIVVESEVSGQKVSKSVDITYGSDTTGPAVQLSAGEVLVNSEVILTADVGSAEDVIILERYNGVSSLYRPDWVSGRLEELNYLREAGSYTYACMVYQNGHWSVPGPAATVNVVSYGEIGATELQGLPQGVWQAGRDLTLTYTPAENSDGYNIDAYDQKNDEYRFSSTGYRGTITLEGNKLTEGTYTLRFRPLAKEGYTVPEAAQKTYTLVVEGALPGAPTVSAPAEAKTHGTVALTCTVESVPAKWKVTRSWEESDGEYLETEEFAGTEASQVLEVSTGMKVCAVSYTVSAEIDGVWTQYSQPVTVHVVSYGEVGVTELQGLPQGTWQAGRDLTLTYTPAENSDGYYIGAYDQKNDEFRFGSGGYRGTITLEGNKLTEGTYTLRFRPLAKEGYTVPEAAQKTYTLVVEGALPGAPTVAAAVETAITESKIELTCEASGVPESWKVCKTVYRIADGGYEEYSSWTNTYEGTAAKQVLQMDTDSEAGKVVYEVSAKIDGIWSLYSAPVTVTLTPAPWKAPGSLRLYEGASSVYRYYVNTPYSVRWWDVGNGMVGYEVLIEDKDGHEMLREKVEPDSENSYYIYAFSGFPTVGEYTVSVRTLGDGIRKLDSEWTTLSVEAMDFDLTLTGPDELAVNTESTFHAAVNGAETPDSFRIEIVQADGSERSAYSDYVEGGSAEADIAATFTVTGAAKARASYYQSGEGYRYSAWKNVTVTSTGKVAAPSITAETPQVEPGEWATVSWTAEENASGYRLTVFYPDGTKSGPYDYNSSDSTSEQKRVRQKGTYRFELQLIGAPGYEDSDPVSCTIESDTDKIFVTSDSTLIGYFGTDAAVVIPAEVDGVTVRSIDHGAFENNKTITSVTYPDTVSLLSDYGAFDGCTSLTSLTIPASVTKISDYFIYDSNLLERLTIYGYAGSAAEAYANSKGITFVALGQAGAGNISFTLDRTTVHEGGSVKATITAPDAEAVRVVKDGSAGYEYVPTDGVCTISVYCNAVGTVDLAVQQKVDGEWLVPSASKKVTVTGPLAAPEVTTAGSYVWQPVTISCAPVEDAVRYTMEYGWLDERGNTVWLAGERELTLGENGLWSYTTSEDEMVRATTYFVKVKAYAEDGAFSSDEVSFVLTAASETAGNISFTLGAKRLYRGGSVEMTVTAPDAEAVRVVYGDGSIGAEWIPTEGQCTIDVTIREAGTQNLSVQQKVNGEWLPPCEGQEITAVELGAPVLKITGETARRPVTFSCEPVEDAVSYRLEISWRDENGKAHSHSADLTAGENYITEDDDLPDEGEYQATLRAYAADGGFSSTVAYFSLHQPVLALEAPVVEEIGDIPVHKPHTASWSAVENAAEYVVDVVCVDDNVKLFSGTLTDTSVVLLDTEGMQGQAYRLVDTGHTKFRVTVTARAVGYADASASVDFTMNIVQLDPPEVELAERTYWHEGETISWKPVNGAEDYTLRVVAHTPDGDMRVYSELFSSANQTGVTLMPGSNPLFSVTYLTYGDCDYTVTMEARAKNCYSSSTTRDFHMETLTLDAPKLTAADEAVRVEPYEVSWEKVNVASSYTVEVLDANRNAVYGPTTTTQLSHTISLRDGLEEGDYTLRVRAKHPYTNDGVAEQTVHVLPLYEYSVQGGEAEITRYNGHEKEPTIPPSYQGVPVTKISDGAFEGNTFIERIVLTSSVTEIGERAFKNCSSLTEFIGSGVRKVGREAFYGCVNLENCVLYRDEEGRLSVWFSQWAFYGCEKLEAEDVTKEEKEETAPFESAYDPFVLSVTYPEGYVSIEERTHYANTNLESVYLPSTLKHIRSGAFADCGTGLTRVELYGSTGDIADDAFDGDPNVEFYIYTEDFTKISPAQQYAIDHGIPYHLMAMPGDDPIQVGSGEDQGQWQDQVTYLLVDWNTAIQIDGTYADRVVVDFGDGSTGSYSFVESHTVIWNTWEKCGTYELTFTTYNGSQQADQTKRTVKVVGNKLTASPSSLYTGDVVHLRATSTEQSGTMYFYTDDMSVPFAQAEIVNGVAEVDYAFTKAGERVVKAVCDASGDVELTYFNYEDWHRYEKLEGKLISGGGTLNILAVGQLEQPVLQYEPIQQLKDGLSLTWKATENTDGYRLYLFDAAGTQIKSFDIAAQPGETQSYTVPTDELSGAGAYSFYLMNYGHRYDQNQSELAQVLMIDEKTTAFIMDKTEVMTGEDVTFTIIAPGADQVQLRVDGAAYENVALTDGKATYTRTFTRSGKRMIAVSAHRAGEWGEPCEAQLLHVTSVGKLDAPVITVKSVHLLGMDVTLSWQSVAHADGYSVYVYDANGNLTYQSKITETGLTVPNNAFPMLGTYSLVVIAYGRGYDQAQGNAQTEVRERLAGPEIVAPSAGETLGSKDVKVIWKAVDDAAGYVITLARRTVNAAGEAVYEKVWAAPNEVIEIGNALSYTLTGLKFGQQYRVAVGALAQKGETNAAKIGWSQCEFTVSLKPRKPAVTYKPMEIWQGTNVTFIITGDDNAQMMDVYMIQNGEEKLIETIRDYDVNFPPKAEHIFTYAYTPEQEGTITFRFVPLNEDLEFGESCYVDVPVRKEGELPPAKLLNPTQDDILLEMTTVEWEKQEFGGRVFGGYYVTLEQQTQDGWNTVYNQSVSDAEHTCDLPKLEDGAHYKLHVYTLKKGQAAPDADTAETTAEFSYRTVPDFAITGIDSTEIIRHDVTVNWKAPQWKRDAAQKPDYYVVWWWGGGLKHNGLDGYPMQVDGSQTNCTLPAEMVKNGGSYTAEVYAILGESQTLGHGANAFTIQTPEVQIDTVAVKDDDILSGEISLSGHVSGGAETVVITLLENDQPISFTSGAYSGKALVLACSNHQYAEALTVANPDANKTYNIRVDGFIFPEEAVKQQNVACTAIRRVEAGAGRITSLRLSGASVMEQWRYHSAGVTKYEVYTDGRIRQILVLLDGEQMAFEPTVKRIENGQYIYEIELNLTEGVHDLSFTTNRDSTKAETHVASIRFLNAAQTAYAGMRGANLKTWPAASWSVARKIDMNTQVLQRGACGDYAYVKVGNVNYFVLKSELMQSAYQEETEYHIVDPKQGETKFISDEQSLMVSWTPCARAVYFTVTLIDAETNEVLVKKTVKAAHSEEKLMAGLGTAMPISNESTTFTKAEFGENFDWLQVRSMTVTVEPYGAEN